MGLNGPSGGTALDSVSDTRGVSGMLSYDVEGSQSIPRTFAGYGSLPEALRRQIVQGVPRWSAFIRQEAERFGYAYVDMVSDFSQRLAEAEIVLTTGV